jgi:hypothetical protein
MLRRDFLKAAGVSVGYSLRVCADPASFDAADLSSAAMVEVSRTRPYTGI